MRRLFALFALMFLLQAVPAQADMPDAKGADDLRKTVSEAISWYTDVSKAAGSGLNYTGEISVMPGPKFYTIKIPAVAFTTNGGFKVEIGDIVANAVAGEEGAWVLSVALPKSMPVRDAAGTVISDLTLGSQRFSSVWAPALDTFTKYDVEYHDIALTPRGKTPYSFKVGTLTSAMNMVRNADSTWSGPRALEVLNATFAMTGQGDGKIAGSIARTATRGNFEKLSLSNIKAAKDKVRALVNTDKGQLSDEQLQSKMLKILQETYSLPDNYSSKSEVEGVAIDLTPDTTDPAAKYGPIHIALSKSVFSSELAGLKQPSGKITGLANISSLKVTGLPEPVAGLVPEVLNSDMRFDNLPMQQFSKIFSDIMSQAAAGGGSSTEQAKIGQDMRAIIAGLPKTLGDAHTSFAVKDTYVNARDLSAMIGGRLDGAATSPFGAAGAMTFTLRGLDELIIKYRNLGASNPEALRYVQMMVFLQLSGQLTKGEDGVSLRTFKFELTPEGGLLLNGNDMAMVQALMAPGLSPGLPGAAPKAPVPAAP